MTEIEPTQFPPVHTPLVDFDEPAKPVEDDTIAPMPVWLSIIVILLSLSAGGWIVKWYVGTDMLARETRILDENPPAVGVRPAFVGPAVRQQGDAWIIRCPEAVLQIVTPPKKPERVRSLSYVNYDFVPLDERTPLFTARRIQRDAAVAKSLAITADQSTKLRALEQQINMATQPADNDKLLSLWTAYQSATDKTKPLEALQAEMTAIARRSVPATKALAADRAAKIRAVLTADQWKKYEAMGR